MQVFQFDTVDSTNDAAKRLIAEGRIVGDAYIVAHEQTAGRGTQGRAWHSPRIAGIYLSLVRLDVGAATPDTTLHTLAAGVGCAEALAAITGVDVRLKPINDLIVGGGKLGGILTEAFIESGSVRALITGIGVNVCEAHRPLPTGAMPATSLERLMAPSRFSALDAAALVGAMVEAVRCRQQQVLDGQGERIRQASLALGAET